jgi:hypothetical protein
VRGPPCSETKQLSDKAAEPRGVRQAVSWRSGPTGVGGRGTTRDVCHVVSRMCHTAGGASRDTSGPVSRLASPPGALYWPTRRGRWRREGAGASQGSQGVGGADQRRHRRWRQAGRRGPTERRHEPTLWDFRLRERGPQRGETAARHAEPLGSAPTASRGRCHTGPVHGQLRPDGATGAVGLDKADKVPEEGAFGPHLAPESCPHPEGGGQMAVEASVAHTVSPSQGKATATQAVTSSCASLPVVCSERCPSPSATALHRAS